MNHRKNRPKPIFLLYSLLYTHYFILRKDMDKDFMKFISILVILFICKPRRELMMTKMYSTFQSFLFQSKVGLYISFFKHKYLLAIQIIYMLQDSFILLGKEMLDSKDQLIIVTSSGYYLRIGTIMFSLFIIIRKLILIEKSIVYHIISITDKVR